MVIDDFVKEGSEGIDGLRSWPLVLENQRFDRTGAYLVGEDLLNSILFHHTC